MFNSKKKYVSRFMLKPKTFVFAKTNNILYIHTGHATLIATNTHVYILINEI